MEKYLKIRTFKPVDDLIKEGDKVVYTPDYYYAKYKGKEGVVEALNFYYKNRPQQFGSIYFGKSFGSKEFCHGGEVKVYEDKWYKVFGYEKVTQRGLIGFLTKGTFKEILKEVEQSSIPEDAHIEYREEQL